ncbi:MAG TPA: GNAT family N-acetyltransferase [Candidatus Scatovicinus merdipullorum]|nr:GNAT family N-acetyltransferase [Candidatus Scatovicinus merdipullorum]
MEIYQIKQNKKQFLKLLLLADEQESMIDRYLSRGTLYALDDKGIKAVCVVTDEGNGIAEIKNLAVEPAWQRKGYGKAMVRYIAQRYKKSYRILRVGTGDSPLTISFYEKCGFCKAFRVKNFFTDNYDHLIFEGGRQLVDMVYLEMKL